jgi:hypothetical protein
MSGGILRRLAALEDLCPPAPPPSPEIRLRQRRWEEVVDRWDLLLHSALPLLTDAEQEQVGGAVAQLGQDRTGPYRDWLQHLAEGWCRLPELSPATMKDLLLAWLSLEADGSMVCRGCGLEYPRHKYPPLSQWKLLPGKWPQVGPPPWYDLPEFFPACPGCGSSRFEIDWPTSTPQHQRSWKDLDGFVG